MTNWANKKKGRTNEFENNETGETFSTLKEIVENHWLNEIWRKFRKQWHSETVKRYVPSHPLSFLFLNRNMQLSEDVIRRFATFFDNLVMSKFGWMKNLNEFWNLSNCSEDSGL